MTEKRGRARSEPVGAGLEHDDEVTDIGFRHLQILGQHVKRRTERPDNGHDLS